MTVFVNELSLDFLAFSLPIETDDCFLAVLFFDSITVLTIKKLNMHIKKLN